ncbi:hypothetical protein C475_18428 [Halosimplex carlsbadense 2-9-1]|uniref:Uncharacterized protein n=1 Tax=Halosimplex carlsbadense 2-9-1 TaxID=797114 RepID=M0CGZ5_9EURY|nr:hypothetical protein [Halosimplex carlsbadense]ELZ22516.1 hypothetical protein C475_18428 [Halosimplex carlsbadense 2-9-1]
MQRVTVDDVPSWAYRGLELLVVGPAVVVALFAFGLFTILDGPMAGSPFSFGALGVGYVGVLALGFFGRLLLPPLVYLDSRSLSGREIDWEPNSILYGIFGFVFGWLVVAEYLYKRHTYVVDWVGSEAWWYCALVGAGGLAVGVLSFAAGLFGTLPVIYLGLPLFAIGLYRDATYVRLNSEWHPNPINHFLAALFSGLFVVLWIPYFGYYVYKRHTHLGLL